MTEYNKLVRDKIPEIIVGKGGSPEFHVAPEAEFVTKVDEKIGEELDEYIESGNTEEIADLLEIVKAAARSRGASDQELDILSTTILGSDTPADERLTIAVGKYRNSTSNETLQELLSAICVAANAHGMSLEALESVRSKKYQERGGFEKRIILERS